MTLKGNRCVVIGGHTRFIWGRLVLKKNILPLHVIIIVACVVIYWYSYLSRVHLPASNIPVCSLRVLEEEEPD